MCDAFYAWDYGERKVRKKHRCITCDFLIAPGETASYQTGKWEDKPTTFYQHLECEQAANLIYHGTKDPCALEYGFQEYANNVREYGQRPLKLTDYDKQAFDLIAKAKWRSRHLFLKNVASV